jgi:tripartite-type tricarboxylate transporter receptor subunit TctC
METPMKSLLRLPVIAVSAFGAWLAPDAGCAQPYPTRPLRIVAATTPSSGPDIMARMIGQKITEAWGQQVVVDNRPGASGMIGTEIAARAAADGYTLLIATMLQTIVQAMYPKVPYDLLRDFTPITLMASTPFILSVNHSVRANSVAEFIALAKAKPASLHYGTSGAGSPPHLGAELLRWKTGIDLVHVPYKGIVPAVTAQVAGEIQLTFAAITAVVPMMKAGKVRALGVSSAKRTPLAPEIPTIAETVPGYEFIGWYCLVAPAKTSNAIITRLNTEVVKAIKAPDLQERISNLGAEPIGSTPQEAATFIRAQLAMTREVVKASGAKPE